MSSGKHDDASLLGGEEIWRQLIDSAQNFVVIVGKDQRVQFINDTQPQHRRGDVVGKPFVEFLPPEDRDRVGQTIREAIEQGHTSHYEALGPGADSRTPAWFNTTVSPLRIGDEVAGACLICTDITERRLAEAALQQSVEFNEAVLSASSLGIATYRSDGQCVLANDSLPPMVGATKEQVLRQNFRRIESWKASGLLAAAEDTLSKRIHGRREIHVVSTFGKEIWLDCRVSPFSAHDEPHLLLVVDDVTERVLAEREHRRLETQVQHAQKLESLGILAGGIAHDFNNILTGLLGNADLAQRTLPPESPAHSFLSNIQTAALRAADLTSQMLAYSGKGTLVMEDIDINALVRDLSSLLQSAVSKKVELRYDLSSQLPAVTVDPTQLRQIVLNLVTNASEATGDDGGVVRIDTYACDGAGANVDATCRDAEAAGRRYLAIEVTDDGCGMDGPTKAKVFDPFFTTKFTGRGLGLAAVQGIVRRHQGTLLLETELGKGTTFKVLLPALDHPAPAPAGGVEEHDSWRGAGTILLVDDEDMVCTVATQMLEELGFDVLTAADGFAAVEIFQARHEDIACVVLDLKMPRMGGEETFDELRRIDDGVVVVISSGYSEQEFAERLGDRGLAGFLHKPYETAQLAAKLREALGD